MTNQTPYGPPAAPSAGFWARLWAGRTTGQRAGLIVAAVLVSCCGGLTAIGSFIDDPQQAAESSRQAAADTGQAAPIDPPPASPSRPAAPDSAASSAPVGAGTVSTRATSASPAQSETAQPQTGRSVATQSAAQSGASVTTRTVTESRTIAYSTRKVKDPDLDSGVTEVRTKGVNGVRTLTYRVTTAADGRTSRKLVSSKVTRKPVTKVIAVGTRADNKCDPNYSGCVPIASDVDCAGGSGNGPEYVSGPVKVIGSDIYDLDRDNDGYGCDD